LARGEKPIHSSTKPTLLPAVGGVPRTSSVPVMPGAGAALPVHRSSVGSGRVVQPPVPTVTA
jgi:hypothetical protein